jgi:hypothetical protein
MKRWYVYIYTLSTDSDRGTCTLLKTCKRVPILFFIYTCMCTMQILIVIHGRWSQFVPSSGAHLWPMLGPYWACCRACCPACCPACCSACCRACCRACPSACCCAAIVQHAAAAAAAAACSMQHATCSSRVVSHVAHVAPHVAHVVLHGVHDVHDAAAAAAAAATAAAAAAAAARRLRNENILCQCPRLLDANGFADSHLQRGRFANLQNAICKFRGLEKKSENFFT